MYWKCLLVIHGVNSLGRRGANGMAPREARVYIPNVALAAAAGDRVATDTGAINGRGTPRGDRGSGYRPTRRWRCMGRVCAVMGKRKRPDGVIHPGVNVGIRRNRPSIPPDVVTNRQGRFCSPPPNWLWLFPPRLAWRILSRPVLSMRRWQGIPWSVCQRFSLRVPAPTAVPQP